eukprot:1159331-Pelagomonas_calceolata.AAC.5
MGLVVEVLLLVIRTNRPALAPEERYPALFKPPPLKHSKRSQQPSGKSQLLSDDQGPSTLTRRSKKQESSVMMKKTQEGAEEGDTAQTLGASGHVHVLGDFRDLARSSGAEGNVQTWLETSGEVGPKHKCA